MQKHISPRRQIVELLAPAVTLVLLLFYTYGVFVRAPYIGLYFNPTNGEVLQIFDPFESPNWGDIFTDSLANPGASTTNDAPGYLHSGDILIKVGDVSWESFSKDSRQGLFNDLKAGNVVDIVVNRNGEEIVVQWEIPGFNQPEFFSRFFNIWWLAYIFWFFGVAAQLFVRPRDVRWRLFSALNYITSLWLIFGVVSARHLWESAILLRATTWAMIPVYLHFHWLFPKPLRPMPKWLVNILHAGSVPFILGEFVQAFPKAFYFLGFLLLLAGVGGLQLIHFARHREQKREVGLVAFAVTLAILPSIFLSLSGVSGSIKQAGVLGLLALPFMPLAYFYVIYRRQFGGLEMRVNRLFSLYAYLILLSAILTLLFNPIVSLNVPGDMSILLALGASIFIAALSISIFPAFQRFVDTRLLGIKLPYQNLSATLSGRIASSESIPAFLQLLNEDVFPSLLVEQFAFTQVSGGKKLKTILSRGVPANQLPGENDLDRLASQAGSYAAAFSFPNEWTRVILPLKVGDHFIGLWLLGRRDPDDFYPQAEIQIMQAIANQTAIALSNLIHADQLRQLYRASINREEQERLSLAHELHDSVLRELSDLPASFGNKAPPRKFMLLYEAAIDRLREIVKDLRPAMWDHGIASGIAGFADNFMDKHDDVVKVKVDIRSGDERFSQEMEHCIFRIVQQACENALKHGRAKTIRITGETSPERIDLAIEDDGAGFDPSLDLGALLLNNHFGLAHMIERARFIGAFLDIESAPQAGATIRFSWSKRSENSVLY